MTTQPARHRSTRRRSRRSWTADGPTCAATPARTCTTPTSCRSTARSMQEARERVTRAAKKLADSGRVGFGFPKEYGGEDDSGGSVTSIEMLAFGDLSLMVKAGVQWGLFGGALQLLGNRAAARQVPARRHELRPARLLRHDRDRPRLRRPAAADDVHLRPRDADLRPAHPAPGRPQGLHRQRGQGRPDGGRLRPADHPGQEPRRARLAGADPQRRRHARARRHDRGRRPEGRAATASTTAG